MTCEVFELVELIVAKAYAAILRTCQRAQQRGQAQAQAWRRAADIEALQWCSRSMWLEMQSHLHCVLAVVLMCVLVAGCVQLPSGAAAAQLAPPAAPPAAPMAETHAAPCLAQCMQDALLERLQAAVVRAQDSVERAHGSLDSAHDALHAARNRMAVDCHEDSALC